MHRGRRGLFLGFVPFILASVVHVGAQFAHHDALAAPSKLLLMPLLIVAVVVALRGGEGDALARWSASKPAWVMLLLGLFCSWLGDGAGTFFPFAPTLPMMLLFFALAHLCYMRLFWKYLALRALSWWALLFAGWWVILVVIMWPRAEGLAVAVAAYGVVLGGTAALSTRCHSWVLLGGLFFLSSDTILAFWLFAPELMPNWTDGMVMLTYTVGQGLITAGAILTLHQRETMHQQRGATG